MKSPNLKGMSIDELIRRYVGLLLEQWACRNGDDRDRHEYQAWNRLADRIAAVHREIKLRGDAGVDALLPLLEHDNPNVRYAAIVHTLRQRTTQALPALEDMAANAAQYEPAVTPTLALDMWRNGKWIVD